MKFVDLILNNKLDEAKEALFDHLIILSQRDLKKLKYMWLLKYMKK
jgi:hypothetical protein